MNLTPIHGRQRAFAHKIAEGHTATEAYLLAGYRPTKRETAHRAASRLYRTPAVRDYISDLRRAGDDLAREETTLTIAQKLAFLARLVLTSSATLREDDPLIQSHRILKNGTTSIRMPCKLKALKMHSDLAGHFPPEPSAPPKTSDPIQDLLDHIRRRVAVPPPRDETRKTSRNCGMSAPTVSSNGTHGPWRQNLTEQHAPPTNAATRLEGRVPPRPAHQTAMEAPFPSPPASHPQNEPQSTSPKDESSPAVNSTITPSPPAQNSQPQQTTTKFLDEAPPLTPAILRKLVLAQIRNSNPIYQTSPSPPPDLSSLRTAQFR